MEKGRNASGNQEWNLFDYPSSAMQRWYDNPDGTPLTKEEKELSKVFVERMRKKRALEKQG